MSNISYQNFQRKQAFESKYLLLGLLGSGTFGKVFKVKDKFNEQIYAMKIVNLFTKIDFDDFLTEVEITRELSFSIFFPKFIDSFTDIEFWDKKVKNLLVPVNGYLVMEYIDGVSLSQFFDCQARAGFVLPRNQALTFMVILFRALCLMHERGIAHNDISSNNIIFEHKKDGVIKIIDFGYSCKFKNSSTINFCGKNNVVGLQYAFPPEVFLYSEYKIKGIKPEWYPKCDIWNMGIVLWILLMVRPIHNTSISSLWKEHKFPYMSKEGIVKFIDLKQALSGNYTLYPPCVFPPDPKLAEIVNSCLNSNPENRPSSQFLSEQLNEIYKKMVI